MTKSQDEATTAHPKATDLIPGSTLTYHEGALVRSELARAIAYVQAARESIDDGAAPLVAIDSAIEDIETEIESIDIGDYPPHGTPPCR